MFRDQTEADLCMTVKVPRAAGIGGASDCNPSPTHPDGCNRTGDDLVGYLRARSAANKVAEKRREVLRETHLARRLQASRLTNEDAEGQSRGEPRAKSKKKHRISLQRVKGVHREAGGETLSVLTAGLGAPAGSDGV